tara:strand:+ start:82 stop:957 length:876 start_codon:yes stop_codon:yes gene_type:complete
MARNFVTEKSYREGEYRIKRVERLPPKGSNIHVYTVLEDNFSKFYKWMPNDGDWEVIDLAAGVLSELSLTAGTNVTITGTGTTLDPFIISSLQDATGTAITTITGLVATNTQEALEELNTNLISVATPNGSETIVQGTGDIDVTGTGTVADPYIVDYASTVPILRNTTLELTAAQVRTLGTTPIEIVAAPGVGKAIEVFTAFAQMTYVAPAFDGGGDLEVACTTAVVGNAQYRLDPLFLSATDNRNLVMQRKATNTGTQIIDNDALVVTSTDSINGGGSVKVQVTYRVVDL